MPQTVHDLAMHYAGLMTIQEPPNTETLRRKVYTEDPTAVLKSLFQANILPVDDIDKAQILSIFDHGEKKNYNIKTDSINTILDDPTLQLTNAAKQYMQRIQRLSLLVEMPEDLKYLLKTPLISAHDISNTPKDTFILSMTTLGLSSKSAVRIYNHALTVESRNEHLWASLQISRLKSAMPAMASSLTAAVITGGETDSSVPVLRGTTLAGSTTAVKPQINYESLFGLIDTNNCDDCDSVNSPAAYFVDLLRFLKNSPSDPTNLKSDSVLTKLFARRPDLQKLQLSCPNTNVLIPYIDLINEVLESYIKSAASGASPINIQAFNMGDDDTSNDRIEHAYGTDYDTYQNIILPQAFPLSIFPYNQAVDSTRAFLSALGSSRSELISVFQAPFLLQSTYSQTSSDAILDLSKASLKNAVSAEALGLQPQDYVAITGSGIFPEAFFNAIGFFTSNPGKTYTGVIGLLGPAQYWGYASNESMVSEAVDGLGLSFVQNQLLPRASITFQELLDILKTEFLNKTLALENSNGGPELSSDVSDLRLRHNMPGKYNSPLTADDCNLLQSFIRLMRKTGLSVFDLDAVLSCFAQGKITSDTINNLATVKRISEKTGIDITSLLPLWGIIDTNGEKSLYARVFLRAGLKSEDSVFDADANGQYLAQNAKISEHISSILSALKLSADQFSVLRTAGNITDDALTLQNLSNLYRMVLLCKVLGINSLDYAIFKTIIGVGIDPFKDPNKTMDLIENWESLTTAGFSLSSIRFVTGNGMDSQKMYGPSAAAALQAGGNIITGLKKISSDYATYDPSNPSSRDLATSAEVSKTSAVLFDPSTAATVTALIERTIPLDEYAKIFYQEMSRFSSVASTFGLELSEVMYFQSLNSSISVDFNNISYSNIVNLSKYTNLRATFSAAAFTLIDFLKWTSRPDRVGTLPEKLAALISWPEHQVKAYITSKFPVMEDVKVVQLFQNDWNELLGMKIVIDFVNKISLDEVQLKSIFTWALPVLDPSTGQDFKIAAALRQAVKPPEDSSNINDAVITKANNTLRNNQRTALIGYLLQQKYIQDRGLIDADSLFDFFLIDVQMGTCLQTSRIKQAISTVQLFVQRCILALEKDSGISSTAVNQDRWSWMQKYRLWDANRKVFLYPENYLEPTLRDDKTELFKTLESSILQTDLNSNTIADQIKAYIYAANTIADLETVSYIWDKGENYQGKFHFFARTRTSPYIYYYRTMEITGQDFVKVFWQPWSKMDVDIPVQEVDSDGKKLAVPGCYLSPVLFRNRVFLFIPQLTLKSLPNAGVGKKSATQVGNEPVNDNAPQKYWEVQIGWTEFRNGKWSPKEVSQATLSVANSSYAKLMQLPGIGDFKFWVRERQNAYDPAAPGIVVVDIERQVGPLANNFTINGTSVSISKDSPYISIPLGRFEMRGPKLMLANPAPGDVYMKPGGYTVPTTFQKYSWSYNRSKLEPPAPSAIGVTRGNETEQPLLGYALDAKPPDSKAVVTATWALAFDELNSTVLGFVQDRSTSETNRSYFHYPPINYDALVSSQNPNKFASASFPTDQFQHVLSPALMEVATVFDGLDDIYRQLAKTKDADISSAFGGRNGKPYHELANPYSIYNWEVGVHAVMLLMERLLATQQFDLAIQVARYVFDPTANGASLDRCWLFPPFKDPSITKGTSINDILSGLTPSPGSESSMSTALVEWRNHPFMAHSIARGRPVAYMKRIVMKYIEILIASGDEYFRQNSLESLPLAIQRYVEASHIFGPAPKLIPKLGRKKYKTYSDLEAQLNDFSNAAADLELSFPFLADPAGRGAGGGAAITGIMKSTYFCIPANPNLIALRNLIDDRLFKIRHCQDINGNARSLALFDPPIDPLLLTRAQANGLSLSSILNDLDTPMPNYRFFYLLQKALELCGELKSLGALFLAAKEKKDSEALSALRARQDTAIQNLILDYKQLQKKEAQATIDSLQETRLGQVTRLSYFLQLAGETAKEIPGADSGWDDIQQVIEKPTDDDLRMSSNEKLELDKADEAAKLNMDATVLDISTSIIAALPDIDANTMPLGCGVTVGAITANIAKAMGLASEVLRGFATDSSNQSARASRKAQLIRQLQDRRLQANIAGRDIKVTDKQIATQQVRVDMCNSDIKTQQKQIADAIEMEKYLKSKYTSEALYSWMDSSVRSLFYQTYTLASDLAMKAQRAYQFERPSNGTSFINTGYWDNSRDGMLSAENLYLNLKRMESSYLENRAYDFEIVKNISLRQLRPWALIQLRETGVAEFDIPEVMFDFDFPGQYCRRIKSVSLSVPCIVGPYTGVNMTLSLVKHQYRVQGVSSNSKYEQSGDDDPRFRTDRTPITSIAVSHGQQDSGVFQLNFQDERYIPFEGAGAISTWRVELPTTVKQFDYESISDVILHMRYTAVNGSMALKRAASTYVTNFQKATENIGLTNGISAVFDLKNDFPNEWYNLTRSGADGASVNVTMATLINRLPFWTKGRNVRAKGASVAIAPTAGAATVDWSKELTMAVDSNNIALKKGVDVGSCKVLMTATDLDLPLKGDWKVTLSPMAKKSVPERIFLVVLYIVSG
ncbi:hypothetical protein BGZ60DRAFT_476567 [Tricladium varicosporioides]|nr:hypothetical protein BGZ60DRAFT_476567 [Hymenoscyphus varicosporioides]